jgi:excinuclease ABC subunit A
MNSPKPMKLGAIPSGITGKQAIVVHGAREHNLRDLDVAIPKRRLVVFTGPSGSGKSSLAFDTIYAEGQRRYVESLSTYARQFLGAMEKPDVDKLDGLSPTISIEQKTSSNNPRSTVGTVTEIYDHIRVLWAQLGVQHCYSCGEPVESSSEDAIVERILELPERTKYILLAPLVRNRKGEYKDLFDKLRKSGFTRARVDGSIVDLSDIEKVELHKKHNIDVVIDRIIAKKGIAPRVEESVARGLAAGDGRLLLHVPGEERDRLFSLERTCQTCDIAYPELTHQSFSFNSPLGQCSTCRGKGVTPQLDPSLLVVDGSISLKRGAVAAIGPAPGERGSKSFSASKEVAHIWERLKELEDDGWIDLDEPWDDIHARKQDSLLEGKKGFEGIGPMVVKARKKARKAARAHLDEFFVDRPCPTCDGDRLSAASRSVLLHGRSLATLNAEQIDDARDFFAELELNDKETLIGGELVKEIRDRLQFLVNVGLSYLSLGRGADTLSGGEAQRIRLASQLGSELTGILYILDEPSIGLHQRDNRRLLDTLQELRDRGNSIIVVEHDRETMELADYILDFGPGAGRDGGDIVAYGPPAVIEATDGSVTGDYLAGRRDLERRTERRPTHGKALIIKGARHNNLKSIDVKIPVGTFTCITGVSGAGKSSLVNEIIYPAIARNVYYKHRTIGDVDSISGIEHFDKVIEIDQAPIGRTPRSNPATYTKVFDHIREFFANLPEAKMYGFDRGRFSFNTTGGRCEECQGAGSKKVEMNFLADVYVPCERCMGKRFNHTTLMVQYKGKSIADVLSMTVAEAAEFFEHHPKISRMLQTLLDVGLDYVQLGQPSTTLSGGEAQRIKLSRELAKIATGQTLYILDEPSTGLHFDDIRKLLGVIHQLVDAGNTVVMIEHNLDIIAAADYLIDLGPEGGSEGGELVAEGTPEDVAQVEGSYTGRFLAEVFAP